MAHCSSIFAAPVDVNKVIPAELRTKPSELVAHLSTRLFQAPAPEKEHEAFLQYLKAREPDTGDATMRGLLHLMMSTPQFRRLTNHMEPTLHTRRKFLRTSMLGAAASWTTVCCQKTFFTLGTVAAGAVTQAVTGKDGTILVVLQMAGGNDGLNMVVPFADDAYYRSRPRLAIPADQILKLDSTAGLGLKPHRIEVALRRRPSLRHSGRGLSESEPLSLPLY